MRGDIHSEYNLLKELKTAIKSTKTSKYNLFLLIIALSEIATIVAILVKILTR